MIRITRVTNDFIILKLQSSKAVTPHYNFIKLQTRHVQIIAFTFLLETSLNITKGTAMR